MERPQKTLWLLSSLSATPPFGGGRLPWRSSWKEELRRPVHSAKRTLSWQLTFPAQSCLHMDAALVIMTATSQETMSQNHPANLLPNFWPRNRYFCKAAQAGEAGYAAEGDSYRTYWGVRLPVLLRKVINCGNVWRGKDNGQFSGVELERQFCLKPHTFRFHPRPHLEHHRIFPNVPPPPITS